MTKLKQTQQEPMVEMQWVDSKTNLRHTFKCKQSAVLRHTQLMKSNPYIKSFGVINGK